MARYKLIDGKKKKFTKAEETARDQEEEQALIERENYLEELKTKQAKKESGRQKLKDLGLDDDEIDALIN
mgnify:CR=1 FL=1|tara:strand:- start:234 stop:443 length:210 start_codon:yes stop_codon:yes gene_type:complete